MFGDGQNLTTELAAVEMNSNLSSSLSTNGLVSDLPLVPADQMNSIVNVTREFPLDYATIILGYLSPVVLLVSIVTNMLVVAVLSQRHMRTPTNIVLLMMAIVDMVTMLSPSPWYFYIYTLGNHNKFLYPPAACYAHHLMTDVVPIFFHTSSIWLALLLASQRYIYVCHPTLARTWCTVPRVKRAICAILAIAFLHQLSRFFDNTFTAVRLDLGPGNRPEVCKNDIADWVQSIHVPIYYTTYFTFRIFFVFIIPIMALIALNWLLFRALKRAETKRCMLLKSKFKIIGVDPTTQTERNSHAFGGFGGRSVTSYASPLTAGACLLNRASQVGLDLVDHSTKMKPTADQHNKRDGESCREVNQSADAANDRANKQLDFSTRDSNETDRGGSGPNKQVLNDSNSKSTTAPNDDAVKCHSNEPSRQRRTNGKIKLNLRSGQSSRSFSGGGGGSGNSSDSNSKSDSQSSRSSETNSSEATTKTDDEDLSTCAECAAYERELRRSCGQCSATEEMTTHGAGPASATCEHHRPNYHHRHLLNHQPISQCSSILGGATNTTNEDEISSSLATQNISSSIFVPTEKDGVETSSMRCSDDEEQAAQVGQLSIDCADGLDTEQVGGRLARGHNETTCCSAGSSKHKPRPSHFRAADADLGQLIKSGSVDSRLACGCLSAKAMALRRIRSIGRHKAHEAAATAHSTGEQLGRLSCNCKGGSRQQSSWWQQDQNGGQYCAINQKGYSNRHFDGTRDLTDERRTHEPVAVQTKSTASLSMKQTAQSPHQKMPNCEWPPVKRSDGTQLVGNQQLLQQSSGQTIVFQPSTTLTTTLCSATTSSAGSLSRVQIGGRDDDDDDGQARIGQANDSEFATDSRQKTQIKSAQLTNSETSQLTAGLHEQRGKSSSFASCTTGRGSRTTLLGTASATAAVPMVVSGQQNNIHATLHPVSTRSMDSNRTTLMLVVVVTVFLFVEVPVAITTIAHVILNTFDVFKELDVNLCLNYIKLFTNFMIMITYSVNFAIYCSMSKRFRETFRDLFCCDRSGQRRRTKRIFSQSQAPHCTQLNPHQFTPASTMMNSTINHANNNQQLNNNNYSNHLNQTVTKPGRQLGDLIGSAAMGEQILLGSSGAARRLNGRVSMNHSECEL